MHRALAAFLIVTILPLSGCRNFLYNKMKAKPAPDSGFLKHPEEMTKRTNRFPFDRYWCMDWEAMSLFTEIKIAPVNTDHIRKMSLWQEMSARTPEIEKDRERMALQMQKAFEKAVEKDPKARFELVNKVGPKTQVLEMALVGLVPSKATFNAASSVAGFFVTGAGEATMLGKGSVAMEARVRDGGSGEVICMFADREKTKDAPLNLAQYTWYRPATDIINEWAKDYIKISNSPIPLEVKGSRPFTLKPW